MTVAGLTQLRLVEVAPAVLDSLPVEEANELLVRWRHRLGLLDRPFGMHAYALFLDGQPVSVADSASAVSDTISGTSRQGGEAIRFRRGEVVELARLCTAPQHPWATRVMLRVWREVFARRWPYWPVRAAISYSQNAHHPGHTYRLDGWERMREDCGKPAGRTSSWSHSIGPGHPAYGPKTLWVWRYPSPADRPPVPAREAAGESARPPEVQEALL